MSAIRKLIFALLLLPALSPEAGAQFMYYEADGSRLVAGQNFYSAGNITSVSYSSAPEVFATGGWFQNTTNGNGLYNQASGAYFYAYGSYWNIASPSGSIRLTFRSNHEYYSPTTYGSVYGDGTNFGLQNNAGSWMFYSAGASTVVNVPGSMIIGSYGGLADNTNSIYGGLTLDTAKGGYYGILFGPNASFANFMWDGSGNGGWFYEGVKWRDYWTQSARTWTINGRLQANTQAQSDTYPVVTKAVYRTYCTGGNGLCYPPACPNGTTQSAIGSNVLGSSWYGYRDCCWGID